MTGLYGADMAQAGEDRAIRQEEVEVVVDVGGP